MVEIYEHFSFILKQFWKNYFWIASWEYIASQGDIFNETIHAIISWCKINETWPFD